MVMQIEHIDAIARQKQRDVLLVVFKNAPKPGGKSKHPKLFTKVKWEQMAIRDTIIKWLKAHGIDWQPCNGIADFNSMMPYQGQIYIDLPFDESLPLFQELQQFMENPDGTMRYPEAILSYCPLDRAMENAEHDEPGLRER
jgi:hypothetical protein